MVKRCKRVRTGRIPLRCGLGDHICNSCFRLENALLKQNSHGCMVEQMVSLPPELHIEVVSLI